MSGKRQTRSNLASGKTRSDLPVTITDSQLMDYLDGKLSPEEQHNLENFLNVEGMESDALEGLKNIDSGSAKQSIKRLNRNLAKSLGRKKKRSEQPVSLSGTIVSIVIVLLLAVAAFVVLRLLSQVR